jgi:hypothetical protein
MTPEKLARELGGGWRRHPHGVTNEIVLTEVEAERLVDCIDELERRITDLERYGPHDES